MKYKNIILENCNFDVHYSCIASEIELAVFDIETNKQLYIDFETPTVNEELACERIHNDICENNLENGEFEWQWKRYIWKISLYN